MEEKELKELAELLFPGIDKTPEDYEEIYPERNLPDAAFGAVTQFLNFVHSHSFSHRQRYKTLRSCRRYSAWSEMDLIWT